MEEPGGIYPSVVEVNAQLLVCSHPLNVKSLDVHWFNLRCFPAEVCDHLFCLTGLNVKMVEPPPVFL